MCAFCVSPEPALKPLPVTCTPTSRPFADPTGTGTGTTMTAPAAAAAAAGGAGDALSAPFAGIYADGHLEDRDGALFDNALVNVAAAFWLVMSVAMREAVAQAVREGIPAVNFLAPIVAWIDRRRGLANKLIGVNSAPILMRGPKKKRNLHHLLLYIRANVLGGHGASLVPACKEVRTGTVMYSSHIICIAPTHHPPFHPVAVLEPHKAGSMGGVRRRGLPSVLAVVSVYGHTSGPADIDRRGAERGGHVLRAVRQHAGNKDEVRGSWDRAVF